MAEDDINLTKLPMYNMATNIVDDHVDQERVDNITEMIEDDMGRLEKLREERRRQSVLLETNKEYRDKYIEDQEKKRKIKENIDSINVIKENMGKDVSIKSDDKCDDINLDNSSSVYIAHVDNIHIHFHKSKN